MKKFTLCAILVLSCVKFAFGAGTLAPQTSGLKPAEIVSHDVEVTINNGFAKTEVTQCFRNVNDTVMEAIYSFPVPKSASLSECSVLVGEQTMTGEVVPRDRAHEVYEKEKSSGNNAAVADKNGYQDFTFSIANIQPQDLATISFVYYQPLPVDTGTCRYVYPLEEGNTKDTAAENFWTRNNRPTGKTNVHVILRSAWPLSAWRAPYGNAQIASEDLDNGEVDVTFELSEGLTQDFVFYYMLTDNLPGRLEVIPFKEEGKDEGTFMMVLTPGIDLKPLDAGSDYVFVLDVSGSMSGSKLRTLADGVAQTIGKLNANDRFRIVSFSNEAYDLTGGYLNATESNVNKGIEIVKGLNPLGSTNLYDGIKTGLQKIDADRVTSMVLVTDGVANVGNISPAQFAGLLRKQDIRVFGFLMGNSANWPLMRTICETSGGFYDGVSNNDDIVGRILLAKSKITHEAMHDVKVTVSGVKTADVTSQAVKKLYRGQQLVMFGKYIGHGKGKVTMKTRISGEDKEYSCNVDFPESDTDNPELERLWALATIEMNEDLCNSGLLPEGEFKDIQKSLGVEYQLVTDETSMIVLTDDAHARNNIDRRNQSRTAKEHAAQSARKSTPVKNYRVDAPEDQQNAYMPPSQRQHNSGMFNFHAPRLGGGAMSPWTVVALFAVIFGAAGLKNGNHDDNEK